MILVKTDSPQSPSGIEVSTPAKSGISLKQIVKIALGVGLIAFLLQKTGIENTFAELSRANLWYIPACIGVYLLAQFISAYRWKFLAEALDFRVSLRELYDYYLIGMFFNQFLPGAIGGDAVRMFYLAKSAQRKKREALLTLLAERGVGLVTILLLTCLISLAPSISAVGWDITPGELGITLQNSVFANFHWDIVLTIKALSLLGLLGYIALLMTPLQRWITRFPKLALLGQARTYWANMPLLIRSITVSTLVQALMIGIHLLIAQALHLNVPPLQIALIYGMVSLISVLPLTQGGLGVRELSYQLLLAKVGVNPNTGLAFAVYWLAISTVTSLFGGLILLKGHYKAPTPQEEAAMIEN